MGRRTGELNDSRWLVVPRRKKSFVWSNAVTIRFPSTTISNARVSG